MAAGQTNVLQTSADLANWTALTTNVAPDTAMTFSHEVTAPRAFFRLGDPGPPAPVDAPYQWECQSPLPQGQQLYGVSALDPSNVWAVGSSIHGGADGTIIHWDGAGWSVQVSGLVSGLFGICAVGSNHVWAVGAQGAILHYDGTRWRPQVSGTTQWLYGVSAQDASNVWAVGYNNTILHYDGAQWRSQPVPENDPLPATITSVSALAGDNVWAAGATYSMNALHYDGTQWSKVPSITGNQWGVSALDRNHVWMVGLRGGIAFFDGTQGQRQDQKANTLRAISASAPDNAWAVGNGTILHYNGTGWAAQNATVPLYSVTTLSATEAWAVGDNDTILHTTNSGTSGERQGTSTIADADMVSVCALSPLSAWVAGHAADGYSTFCHTSDAGQNWQQQGVAGWPLPDLIAVAFATPALPPPPGPTANYLSVQWAGTDLRLTGLGLPGTNYALEVTPALTPPGHLDPHGHEYGGGERGFDVHQHALRHQPLLSDPDKCHPLLTLLGRVGNGVCQRCQVGATSLGA